MAIANTRIHESEVSESAWKAAALRMLYTVTIKKPAAYTRRQAVSQS